jgi:hypothetical protein
VTFQIETNSRQTHPRKNLRFRKLFGKVLIGEDFSEEIKSPELIPENEIESTILKF